MKRADISPWGADQTGAPTLSSVARLIESPQTRNVVILAGAGISTASGIPDFRSPQTGLYANLQRYDLPYPEAIFDIDYFHRKPQPFFTLSKELYPGNFAPTLSHTFFRLLDEKKKLLRVFTQNIDTLERVAGLDAERIVEAHGSFAVSRCTQCKRQVDAQWMRTKVMAGDIARCPHSNCRRGRHGAGASGEAALVKPDIVFFGEGLPDRFFEQLGDLKKADLLLVLGTSLQVQPFASLIDRVNPTCARVLINLERVGELAAFEGAGGGGGRSGLDRLFGGMRGAMNESGFDFEGWTLRKDHGKEHIRDVFWQGKCDEGVTELAKELGWERELQQMHEEVCQRVHSEKQTTEESTSGKGPAQQAQKKELTEEAKNGDESLRGAQQKADTVAKDVAAAIEKDAESAATDVDDLTAEMKRVEVSDEQQDAADGDRTRVISADANSSGEKDGEKRPSL